MTAYLCDVANFKIKLTNKLIRKIRMKTIKRLLGGAKKIIEVISKQSKIIGVASFILLNYNVSS